MSQLFESPKVLCALVAIGVSVSTIPSRMQSQSPQEHTVTGATQTASPQKPQETRVTLTLRNIPREQALQQIAEQTGLAVSWSQAEVPIKGTVSASLRDVPFTQALAIVLQGTGAQAKLSTDGRKIVIIREETRTPGSKAEATGLVTGQIVDSVTGAGIERVTVSVLGTKLSAITQQNGDFRLSNVPAGQQRLIVKLFGYKSAERIVDVQANSQTVLKIVLVSVPTTLSGVVTTATGMQQRLAVGTDVTRLDVDSIMALAPIKSVTDLLATRVPGLQVLRTSGTPGDPSRLRLRGAGSINGSNAPIVIVDGIRMYSPDSSRNGAGSQLLNGFITGGNYAAPSPLDGLDPNAIETIEVLKGPSASSLYGSDAANGVIVITTKRGTPGTTRWNLALTGGTSAIPGKFQDNLFFFGHQFNGPPERCEVYQKCIRDSLVMFQAMNDARYSPLTRANTSSASATLSGGSQNFLYSFTGSISGQQGLSRLPGIVASAYQRAMGTNPPGWMRRPERYTRFNGSNASTITFSPELNILMSHTVNADEQRRSSLGTMAAAQLLYQYIDRSTIDLPDAAPLLRSYQERAISSRLASQHNISTQWQVRPSVTAHLRAGMNPSSTTGTTFVPAGMSPALLGNTDTSGHFSSSQENTVQTTMGGNTTIPVTLANGVSATIAIGGDMTRQDSKSQFIQMSHLPLGVTEPTSGPNEYTGSSRARLATSTYGLFLQPQLAIASRLFIASGVRMDGGSASGSRVGLTRYPKVEMSWIAVDNASSDASQAIWQRWVSQLRIRSAFGQAGVQPDPSQHFRLLIAKSQTTDGGQTFGTAYDIFSVGNTQLRPERASEFEGGMDVQLFEQRISLNATVFRKYQRDAIMSRGVAPSAGGGQITQSTNIGNILNTGYELQLNAQLLATRPARLDVNAGFSHRKNRLTKRSAEGWSSDTEATRLVVGYPVFGYWALPVAGFADRDGDGILQQQEIILGDSAVYLGASDPKYSATFNTILTLLNGRLTASASLDYQHATTQYNHNGRYPLMAAANATTASLQDQAIAYTVRNSPNGVGDKNNVSTPYYVIQTVNTLRFQSISIGYIVPQSVAQLVRAGQASIALQGNNLGLRTAYRGMDPNVNAYSTGNLSADYGQLPQPREWVLRITVSR